MVKSKKDNIKNLYEIISGEKKLQKREELLRKAKKEAITAQKNKRREEIINKDVELEKDPVQNKKIVQNIKLFEWEGPDRYQVKFKNKNFLVLVVLCLLLILLLAILQHYYMMGSVIAILFLIYVSGTTKAEIITTQIGRASVGKECRSRWSPYH